METTQIGLVPLHNTPLDRDDFPIQKHDEEKDAWYYTVRKQQYVPSAAEWEKILFHKRTRDELTSLIDNPPRTVGELIYQFLQLKAHAATYMNDLNALHAGLGKINEWLNEYAEEENMCSAYEAKLDAWNTMLREEGYHGWFEFEGRTQDIVVTVQRTRTIIETATVGVSMTRDDREAAYEEAVDAAADLDLSDWTEVDDCYSTDDYQAIDYETV